MSQLDPGLPRLDGHEGGVGGNNGVSGGLGKSVAVPCRARFGVGFSPCGNDVAFCLQLLDPRDEPIHMGERALPKRLFDLQGLDVCIAEDADVPLLAQQQQDIQYPLAAGVRPSRNGKDAFATLHHRLHAVLVEEVQRLGRAETAEGRVEEASVFPITVKEGVDVLLPVGEIAAAPAGQEQLHA